MKNLFLFSLFLFIVVALTGCNVGPNPLTNNPNSVGKIAGFWDGLSNGLFLPLNFVVSLFNTKISIYNVYNNGNLYNLGFVMGAASTFGGGLSSIESKSKKS